MKQLTLGFPQLPEKIYFRIGEVSRLVGVDAHVLRYWETEFAIIKPFRGKSKQRLYRRQDVENLLRIKGLLHDEGYTITGARKFLKSQQDNANLTPTKASPIHFEKKGEPMLDLIKKELREILAQLVGTKSRGL